MWKESKDWQLRLWSYEYEMVQISLLLLPVVMNHIGSWATALMPLSPNLSLCVWFHCWAPYLFLSLSLNVVAWEVCSKVWYGLDAEARRAHLMAAGKTSMAGVLRMRTRARLSYFSHSLYWVYHVLKKGVSGRLD